MTDSFWAGGPAAHADALHDQYKPQLDNLRKLRETSDEADRVKLDTEIKRVESEYRSKLDSIDNALF